MRCYLGIHDWVYIHKKEMKSRCGNVSTGYNNRYCNRCGKVQENSGHFDISYDIKNYFVDKWITIGYAEKEDEPNTLTIT